MQSKPLRQAVSLALDTLGMRGPVTRREVAEEVLRSITDDCWCASDREERDLSYIMGAVRKQMNESHSDQFIEERGLAIPDELRPVLQRISRFICVSPNGGADSKHVMAINATVDDWRCSAHLKDKIARATRISRDTDRTVHDFLVANGVNSLGEYLSRGRAA